MLLTFIISMISMTTHVITLQKSADVPNQAFRSSFWAGYSDGGQKVNAGHIKLAMDRATEIRSIGAVNSCVTDTDTRGIPSTSTIRVYLNSRQLSSTTATRIEWELAFSASLLPMQRSRKTQHRASAYGCPMAFLEGFMLSTTKSIVRPKPFKIQGYRQKISRKFFPGVIVVYNWKKLLSSL